MSGRVGSRGRTGSGSGCGTHEGGHGLRGAGGGISLFLTDEGGYTTIAVALAILVSLALAFSVAGVEAISARSADVQTVADSAAMAGADVVSSFTTVATVLDACVLSMGIAGVLVLGAGLVLAAIPGLQPASAEVEKVGCKIIDARRRFAAKASEGLERLEGTLPLLVVMNSASCVSANSSGQMRYTGVAIPFPQESGSDFSSLQDEADGDEVSEDADALSKATERAEEAKRRADAERTAGWYADCGSSPYCLHERAGALAGLSGAANPFYATPDAWTYGAALVRARNYYQRRIATEQPEGQGIEALTDSLARAAFYDYAYDRVMAGHYTEGEDGSVDLDLPGLPGNTDEVRGTPLYTDARWPCTQEDGKAVLHSSATCPGARGAYLGVASVSDIESGAVSLCPDCGMSVGDLGKATAASTSIDNGFEHHWRIVCESARRYQQARNEQAAAEREQKEAADKASDAFDRALDALKVDRPKLCPPGAWGCVAVVGRGEGAQIPSELTSAFLAPGELPASVALSAATLAPDDQTAENNVLSRFFDGVASGGEGTTAGGVADGVGEMWGRLLVSYGSAYESVSGIADRVLSKTGEGENSKTLRWVRKRLAQIVSDAGFEPCDLRLRKPVLCNSQDVLSQAGYDGVGRAREFVESLPNGASPQDVARALGQEVADEVGGTTFTVAELPIPGTDLTVPLTIDLSELAGAL